LEPHAGASARQPTSLHSAGKLARASESNCAARSGRSVDKLAASHHPRILSCAAPSSRSDGSLSRCSASDYGAISRCQSGMVADRSTSVTRALASSNFCVDFNAGAALGPALLSVWRPYVGVFLYPNNAILDVADCGPAVIPDKLNGLGEPHAILQSC